MRRFLILGVAALASALAGCGDTPAGPVAGEEFTSMPADQVIYVMEHYMTTDGVRRAVLRADTAYLYEDSASFSLRGVHLLLYNENGQDAAELTSLTGRLDTRTNRMIARGDVVLVTRVGDRRIETNELHFEPETDRIWSDSSTTMLEGGTRVVGSGFTADSRMQRVEVKRPRGRIEGLRLNF